MLSRRSKLLLALATLAPAATVVWRIAYSELERKAGSEGYTLLTSHPGLLLHLLFLVGLISLMAVIPSIIVDWRRTNRD